MRNQKGLPVGALGEAGQTLLEILLAFSVSILVLSAVIMGIVTSLSNTQYTKNQGLANSYAQEGMAVIRKIRDSSWTSLDSLSLNSFTNKTKYCIDKNLKLSDEVSEEFDCNGEIYGVGVNGFFSREVRFIHNDTECSDGSKATIKVSWGDSKCSAGAGNPLCHNVELITCFSSADKKTEP